MAHGSSVITIVVAVLLVACIGGGALFATYTWQHAKVVELERQLVETQTEDVVIAEVGDAASLSHRYRSDKGVTVSVYTPVSGESVDSPLLVFGKVPGNWSFEGDFPLKLIGDDNTVLAEMPAMLLDDWMTSDLVPFWAEIPFTAGSAEGVTLVLVKDNPSGLAENDDRVTIPLKLSE